MTDKSNSAHSQIPLLRSVGLFTAISVVVANMIGTGIMTTTGLISSHLPGPGWIFFCWVFGGLIALAGALCYSELATRMPHEGGEYVYLRTLFHPLFGFLTGWLSLVVGFSVPVAGAALGFVEYTMAGLTSVPIPADQLVIYKKVAAICLIGIFTLIHYMGVRWGGRIQNLLTVFKVVGLIALSAGGLILGGGRVGRLNLIPENAPAGMAFGTAMMLVMFAYSGWNASAYIAGEVKNPRKNIPRSLILGTLTVMGIYLLINVFILYALPFGELSGTIPVLERASVRVFGEWMGNALGLMVGFALLSSLSAFIIIGPRVYYAMARDGLFFSFAGRIHPYYRVPGRSILVQGSIAAGMVLAGSFEQLLIYLGFSLSLFPWLAVTGLFLARRRRIGEDTAVKVKGFPWVPGFYLAATLLLMVFTYMGRPKESTAAVVTTLLGVPLYWIWVSRK
jgi:APA family basic amino acid/polyamine antiporter